MKLVIKIQLGNDAMQTRGEALAALMQSVFNGTKVPVGTPFDLLDEGSIKDVNGNKVGEWKVTK